MAVTSNEPTYESWLIAPVLVRLYDIAIRCMPSRWIHIAAVRFRSEHPDRWIEGYMIVATLLLVPGWILAGTHLQAHWAQIALLIAAVFIAVVRWLEIVTAALEMVVGKGQARAEAAIAIVTIYAAQAVLIFAIFMEALPSNAFKSSGYLGHPSSAVDFLYVSWTNLITLGNDSVPQSAPAELVVILTGATGIILVGVFLSYAMSRFR